ncbi:MAG: ankyrin repeat domain-containing protein [Smithellaceae bacterium]|nr:ankyrin repeat domain-containing protein [Smithellaceae bacterium]
MSIFKKLFGLKPSASGGIFNRFLLGLVLALPLLVSQTGFAQQSDTDAKELVEIRSKAKKGEVEVKLAKVILSPQDSASVSGNTGISPAFEALRQTNANALVEYLVSGGDPNARNDKGETLLMYANIQQAQALLERGADPRLSDKLGKTVLHWRAADFFVKMYLAGFPTEPVKGAIVLSPNDKGELQGGIQMDGDVSWQRDQAAKGLASDFAYCDLLIAKGADVNALNSQGQTPLDEAVAMIKLAGRSNQEIEDTVFVQYLRKKGAKFSSELKK